MKKLFLFAFIVLIASFTKAATPEQLAETLVDSLSNLITIAESQNIDVTKEQMTVHTAEVFLKYAKWDEINVATNTTQFEAHATYGSNAAQMAADLPDWERNEIISFMNKQIAEINNVITGEISRKDIFWPDWTQVVVEDDQITQNGRPVFLADYIWKPTTDSLIQYYGNTDSEGMRSVYITDSVGGYNTYAYNNYFVGHEDGAIGQIWTDNNNIPGWIKEKYPEIQDGGRHYGHYDVDHPAMRELYADMYELYVPPIADKKVTALGYQLFNEPSFFTKEGSWNNVDEHTGKCVSDYTIAKFKNWLTDLHTDIATLNSLWGTSFENFDSVKVTLPMPGSLQGTPVWYDWMTFNNYRITDWFQFMTDKIKKYDSDARTHIKLMPWTFTSNSKDHGLDFEALTELSGIIGCDAGMQYDHAWDNNGWWRENYALDWKHALMTFDFMKSVKPESFIFDTENHFMMNTGFNLQNLDQEYVRMSYWLGAMHGLTVKNTWVWTRSADGSMTRAPGQSNMTDMSHQPQTLYTITSTYMDLNSYAEEMVAIQRLAKPIRVFYSKTSSINDGTYLEKVFDTYKGVFFDGIPVGFVTENILNKQHDGKVVIVHNTEYVTQGELNALQAYLNSGGTVIMGTNSLLKDEYGRTLPALSAGNGTIINAATIDAIRTAALSVINSEGLTPEIAVKETNGTTVQGCTWKYIKRENENYVLSLINLGNTDATLNISVPGIEDIEITDLFTGKIVNDTTVLEPYGILFVEIRDMTEEIGANTLPTVIYTDSTITFTVDYQANQPRDIHIDLQSKTDWKGYGSVIKTVNGKGTASFTFTPRNTTISGAHRWNLYMTETGKNHEFTIDGTNSNHNVNVIMSVAEISLNITDTTIYTGESFKLNENVLPAGATDKTVSWSSDNTGAATVDNNGLVTAEGVGTATVTATTADGGKTANCIVAVELLNSINTSSDTEITVSPNPAKDYITIAGINEDCVVKIFNLQGTEVIESTVSLNNNIINIKNLISGYYIVTVKSRTFNILIE